ALRLHGDRERGRLLDADVAVHRLLAAPAQADRETRERGRLDRDREGRGVAREDRIATPGANAQVREVAPGVQQSDRGHAAEQEGEQEAEREAVVDRREQEQQEHQREGVALARRQDEDAPLAERDRRRLRHRRAEDPVGNGLPEVGEHGGGRAVTQGIGTAATSSRAGSKPLFTASALPCRRCPTTVGKVACTSSGSTWWRPSMSAQACAARRIATPARGERPCVKRGEWRVWLMSACT